MQPLRIFSIIPKLPAELDPLWFLAHNYWFAWNNEIEELFADIDPALWEESYKNPVWMLNHVPQERYDALAQDEYYKKRLAQQVEALKGYLNAPSTYHFEGVQSGSPAVVYFSFEFGVSLCLPIYSGGLGILAGDHLKSASDLNVPLVGIGLAYANGYFRQYMTPDGWQQERYPDYDFEQMPMQVATTPSGEPAMVHLSIGDRPLAAQIWEAKVGRISLYLLDTNIAENPPEFRAITARLYGGNLEMRLWQEILLGIGGIKALHVLGIEPHVMHMNEGHCAFAGLERVRILMKKNNLPFEVAVELAASGSVFTTHTPVPAGNDRFPPALMQQYFEDYARDMGLAFKVFLALGREEPRDDSEEFCMTVLALKLSRFNNGVSQLHGVVSRKMWHRIWGQFPVDDVPIGAITNGVHAPSWVAPEMGTLFDRYLGETWREERDGSLIWPLVNNIPDAEIWRVHEKLRARLVAFVRQRVRAQMVSQGARARELDDVENFLDPGALTIGFARRFATYKRARLIMEDLESLKRVVSNMDRPVQFIFAGKAHPHDNGGKQLMKEIINLCRENDFWMSMVFLEDYDMEIASHLISGCDVWLNNPRRPLEACGTSGMKAMFNGVLQFSTLDGWWDEAWKADNSLGWAIGKGEEYDDPAYQDKVELQTLYKVLESEIIPDFYERSRGNLPTAWVKRMKAALAEFGPRFHSNRMVSDYVESSYIPACRSHRKLYENNFSAARELSAWRMNIMTKWGDLKVRDVKAVNDDTLYVGQASEVTAKVFLANIPAEHVQLEIYVGHLGQDNTFINRKLLPMHPVGPLEDGWQTYQGSMLAKTAGRFGFTVRAIPVHPLLPTAPSLGLLHWAEE
ncbi:alpha-glucan family phosphorylase [Desulfovibrio sp. OttesenSCG-928-G15]|nr:alpha-glucan family phosphorylase [Desulfovibrio sp. OttesenSCG-928-G15]